MNSPFKFQVNKNTKWRTRFTTVDDTDKRFLVANHINLRGSELIRNMAERRGENEPRGTKRRNLYAVSGYDRRVNDRREPAHP